MKCRACGFEIADKAIVCYRCGAPTAEPVARPVAPAGGPRWLWLTVAVVLAAAALGFLPRTAPGSLGRIAVWSTAALVLLAGLVAGFRRRGAGGRRIR